MAIFCLPASAVAAPAAPAGFSGVALDGRVSLGWQPVAGADSYTVYRGTSATAITTPVIGAGVPPGGLGPPTTLTDTTALDGTTYYYAVRTVIGGVESPNSVVVQATPVARGCGSGNPVTLENCFPGTGNWALGNVTTGIEGYATAQSINRGESVGLKVSSSAKFDVEIYRTGWYGGARGRLFSVIRDVPASPQPACVTDAGSGLTDCSNWSLSQTITTTSSWPSGVYLAKVIRRDTGADNHIIFAVRDDGGSSDILYGVPFTTYQAYNTYGGKSLYDFNSTGATTVSNGPRAVKVSFDRPYAGTRVTDNDDWYPRADAGWVGWLERSGYDVSYTSVFEFEHHPDRLPAHRTFLSGTHDEYWSAAMRNAVQAARDGGTNLLFGGANEEYWKIRFEPSPVSGVSDRVEVCYKTTGGGPPDPSGIPTTTWRDPAGANSPENAIAGQQYIGDKYGTYFPMDVSAAQGKDRVWRFTPLATQAAGTSTRIGTNLYGWEWDGRAANGLEPPGTTTLATGSVNGNILQDAGGTYATGPATATTAHYTASSGALVFSAGTNHWNWGLGTTMAADGAPDSRIQQATTNVLTDMGAVPDTPVAGMQFDDPASPPVVIRRSPSSGASDVGTAAPVTAVFSRAMNAATISASTVTLKRSDGVTIPGTVTYDATTFTAQLTPGAPLTNDTSYTARLDGTIKAANGVAMGSAVSWSFTTASPDRNPPGVAITAPRDNDIVSGTTALLATAADDVGVAGVQFKVDGNAIGAEDTTSPYSAAWDTTTVSSGAHTVTAVARDTSGNTTPTTIHVTVDRSGLVAAYGFEEGSGTTVSDSSGKGNTGTLSNATRSTSGKFGSALSFNGTNALVTVPDAASLDMTSAMTLEAWVNPSTTAAWRTIMLKESTGDFSYALYGSNGSAPGGYVFTTGELGATGTAALPTGTWTHVAETYDGSTVRLFVNGTQVGTAAAPGPITPSSGALRIGGNTIWGEWFNGLIDEVRVYRRALSASEIATDMTTAVKAPVVDTQAPTAPATLTATGGAGQATLSWSAATDDVGVAKYDVYRSTTAGFAPGAGTRIGQPTGTTFTDPGLAAGTYYYRVAAEDAAGNVGPPSPQASATVTGDTTAPTVSLSGPAGGSTVSGTVTVSATANDNVGVVGVLFRLDGQTLGSEDTTSPYQATWDTTTAAAGSHTLTATARDAAGNTTTSATISVTVDNSAPPPSAGLVAAYGFEEATGTSATDSSGKGNNGTLANATRSTSGKFGSALSFNGTNAMVTVPDAASLDLTTGMTLEAWVDPSALGSLWRTVMLKESVGEFSYALYGSNGSRPGGYVFTNAEFGALGTAALATSAWSHLAETYDGSTVRLYVNGTLVGTAAAPGPITPSSGALRIGGNSIWGEWFSGLIDEVRVYDRALSAAQISTDMGTPVVSATPDTTAPSAPGTLTATGSLGQATLSWGAATDDVGVVKYDVYRSTTSGFTPSAANRIAQAPGTTYTDAGVAPGTYYYRVAAEDAAGNVGPATAQAPATVTADTVAPTVSITAPGAGSTVSGTVSVTANATDNVAVAGVQFRLDGNTLGAEDTTSPYSASWDTTTASAGSHTLTAVARDATGNATTSASVSVTVDNSAPPPTAGLVAAYAFSETTGTTTADASGQGNTGTLSNATRTTTGKLGSALAFNGTNSMVSIPASASLNLTTGMTLEAWVNPTAAMGNAWETVVLKERPSALSYALYANTDTGRPSVHGDPGAESDTRGTAAVAAGTWTHLAGTYDGTTLRLYVNGVLVSSKALSGALLTSTGSLRIGGNSIWGEWFKGTIDEVRVYKRALSAAEITADMTRPIP